MCWHLTANLNTQGKVDLSACVRVGQTNNPDSKETILPQLDQNKVQPAHTYQARAAHKNDGFYAK